MRWLLYNLCFGLASLAVLPRMLLRMRRRGGYAAHFEQRFGRYSPALRARLGTGGAIWIHAVSVGEVYVAGQLMRALRALDPTMRFVLSTTSSTGWREAEKLLGDPDTLIYNPLDFPWMVRRALDAVRPRAFLLVETELWPNWIRACAAMTLRFLHDYFVVASNTKAKHTAPDKAQGRSVRGHGRVGCLTEPEHRLPRHCSPARSSVSCSCAQ